MDLPTRSNLGRGCLERQLASSRRLFAHCLGSNSNATFVCAHHIPRDSRCLMCVPRRLLARLKNLFILNPAVLRAPELAGCVVSMDRSRASNGVSQTAASATRVNKRHRAQLVGLPNFLRCGKQCGTKTCVIDVCTAHDGDHHQLISPLFSKQGLFIRRDVDVSVTGGLQHPAPTCSDLTGPGFDASDPATHKPALVKHHPGTRPPVTTLATENGCTEVISARCFTPSEIA